MTAFSRALLTGRAEGRLTARHVALHGAPAAACPWDGLPSYESERGALVVMDNVIVFGGGADRGAMLFPLSYRNAAVRAPEGLTALHDDPDAVWSWRPQLYALGPFDDQRLGSQNELEYRYGLNEAAFRTDERRDALANLALELLREEQAIRGPKLRKNARKRLHRRFMELGRPILAERPELAFVAAQERADALLLENLAPQQRLDLCHGGFFVRGRINRMYEVRVGNGFAIVDPTTREETVSLCLHPENWLPHSDIALATKLGIDAGEETEAELLEAANPTLLRHRGADRTTADERTARRLERRYLGG